MRNAKVERNTAETRISLSLDLDAYSPPKLDTGLPFFSHMLEQVAVHGRLGLRIKAEGDLQVDVHHLVEDIGIVFGQALKQALGDKKGINRFAHAFVPLDEALTRVVVDISGRPGLFYRVDYTVTKVGDFDLQAVGEFFQGLVNHAGITLHVDNLYGDNAHHQVESLFKAFGRALAGAVTQVDDLLPSSKKHL